MSLIKAKGVDICVHNGDVDFENKVIAPSDSLIYRPYAQWTSYVESDGQTTADRSAHYDLMFNRLRYNTTPQKNANPAPPTARARRALFARNTRGNRRACRRTCRPSSARSGRCAHAPRLPR